MNRLSLASLPALPASVRSPNTRSVSGVGIVHFGPGAFHRAHQAAYIDDLLTHDPRWGIAAVSMRTRGTIDALAEQDGLYTLVIRDADPSLRVIGAHRRFLGPEDAAETRALLADPAVALVTTTVTEKGYCLAADGTLDMTHPDIVHDLAGTRVPRSVVGWLIAGLAARRTAGVAPFVPMPCDNLASNGAKLHAALVAFAGRKDASLADWIAGEVRVPSTMVDIYHAGERHRALRRCRRNARRRGSGGRFSVNHLPTGSSRTSDALSAPISPASARPSPTTSAAMRRPSCGSSTARIPR
ncbi:hypothetical protein [Sphingomonas faeni]|uniref:hypothetical protein n=1 Tax=Sphingomonas faeni TaxID=185950 RepID=UPI003EBE8291